MFAVSCVCLYGCSDLVNPGSGDSGQDAQFLLSAGVVTETDARVLAFNFVQCWVAGAEPGTTGAWSTGSVVTAAVPVYNEGLPGVAYWECKVETDGAPAGFVLVTSGNIDMPIPEFSTSGPTAVEQLASRAGTTEFDAFRYGYSGMRALGKGTGADDARSLDLAAEKAWLGVPGLSRRAKSWRENCRSQGTVPYYTRDRLESLRQSQSSRWLKPVESGNAYWARLANFVSTSLATDSRKDQVKRQYTHVWDQPWLKGSDLVQPAGYPALNPDQKYPLGCGATALGIVYAYWKAFKDKPDLYPGVSDILDAKYQVSSNHPEIWTDIKSMATNMGTFWSEGHGSATIFDLRDQGSRYPQDAGYAASNITMDDSGVDQWNLGRKARCMLNENRPPILALYVDKTSLQGSIGWMADHVVVVEEVRKTDWHSSFFGLFWFPWANGSVSYLVNLGWGGDSSSYHRWICTIDVDPAFNPEGVLTSCFQIFDIVVQ